MKNEYPSRQWDATKKVTEFSLVSDCNIE